MTTKRKLLILVSLINIFIIANADKERDGYCLASDTYPYLQFSTKTAYEFVKGKENSQNAVADCKPILFWSLNRHGTRLPGKDSIEELPKLAKIRDDIINNYEIRKTAPDQGRLCEQDIENLKAWTWNGNFTPNHANDLTYQGYDDLKYLAKRWQTRFPNLLPTSYNQQNYLFRYTDKRRTKDSYRAFLDGLFGDRAFNYIPPPQVIPNDTLLELYNNCPLWKTKVQADPITMEQRDNFKKKEEFRNMIQNISLHLGYKYPLEENIVMNIYDMCRYYKSWEINRNSPWCAAFTKDQLRLLEYADDLKYYYETGYGNKLNKKLGCTPIKDMMERFTKMIENINQTQPKAVVYFSHTKTFLTFLTALGIAEDSVPLLADNYRTPNIQRRLWKTSRITPFASNLVAVLHRCQRDEEYKVMFFLNEIPVDFSDCHVGLCSWEMLKKKYGPAIDKCNLEFCYPNAASVNHIFNVYIIIGFAIVALSHRLI